MSHAQALEYTAKHTIPKLAAYQFPEKISIDTTDTSAGDQPLYTEVPANFVFPDKPGQRRDVDINNSIQSKHLYLKIPVYHEGQRMDLSTANLAIVQERGENPERILRIIAEPETEGLFYDLICVEEKSRVWYMNAERKRIFGARSLTFCEQTPTGENDLMTIKADWTARHIFNEQLHINHWEFEILENSSFTVGILKKAAVIKIGTDFKFKPVKNQDLAPQLGVWRLTAERI